MRAIVTLGGLIVVATSIVVVDRLRVRDELARLREEVALSSAHAAESREPARAVVPHATATARVGSAAPRRTGSEPLETGDPTDTEPSAEATAPGELRDVKPYAAALEARLASEEATPAAATRSADLGRRVRELLDETGELAAIDCRSTMCRVEIVAGSVDGANAVIKNLRLSVVVSRYEPVGGEGLRLVMFVGHEGHHVSMDPPAGEPE